MYRTNGLFFGNHEMLRTLFLLYLFLFPMTVWGVACVVNGGACTDTGSNWGCDDGFGGSWRYYCTGGTLNAKIGSNCTGAAGTTCNCGPPDTGGPCDGCADMSKRDANFCLDNDCSTACVQVPELPTEGHAYLGSLPLLLLLAFFYRKRNETLTESSAR